MVRQEFCVPLRTGVRVPLSEVLRAVVVRSTNFDVVTSSVCRNGVFSSIFVINGRFGCHLLTGGGLFFFIALWKGRGLHNLVYLRNILLVLSTVYDIKVLVN